MQKLAPEILRLLKGKTILVLGASGQVGRSFQAILKEWPNVTFAERSPTDPKIKKCDFADAKHLLQIIEDVKPEITINCAAYTAVDLAEKESEQAFSVNATAVGEIAKAVTKTNGLFVHYSTDYVFPGTGSNAYREDDPTAPTNVYGASKREGEVLALKYCPRSFIFRTQWVYAKEGKNFVNTMLRLGTERAELSVVSDQIGAPTSSDVIALYTLKALAKVYSDNLVPGIYHLACRGEISWHQFAEEIFRLAKVKGIPLTVNTVLKIKTADYPTPAKRPLNSRLSTEKLENALHEMLPSWEEALKDRFS